MRVPLASMAEERRMGKNASRIVPTPVGSIERKVSMWRLNVSPEHLIPCDENELFGVNEDYNFERDEILLRAHNLMPLVDGVESALVRTK